MLVLWVCGDDRVEHSRDRIQIKIPCEYREKTEIEKSNDNFDDLCKRRRGQLAIIFSFSIEVAVTYQHNYLTKGNDDRRSMKKNMMKWKVIVSL